MTLSLLFCTAIGALVCANVAAADPSPPLGEPPTGAGWFLSADAGVYALPDPATLAVFAGGGAGF